MLSAYSHLAFRYGIAFQGNMVIQHNAILRSGPYNCIIIVAEQFIDLLKYCISFIDIVYAAQPGRVFLQKTLFIKCNYEKVATFYIIKRYKI